MKRNDIKALHQKTVAELEKMLNDLNLELAAKRLMRKAGRLENVSEVKTLSDDIARVKTILGEKKTK
jgi:ribosomal protein L29